MLSDPLAALAAAKLKADNRPGQLQGHGFRPYSLRRRGATHFFRQTGNLASTTLIGRWKHLSTARLYLQEQKLRCRPLICPMLYRETSHSLRGPDFGDVVASWGRMEAASRSERIVLFRSSPVCLPWEWQTFVDHFVFTPFHFQSMPTSIKVYSLP